MKLLVSGNDDSKCEDLTSLFSIHLSETHATRDQRADFIDELLASNDVKRQEIGLSALKAALSASPSHVFHVFDFGARKRDFGYLPKGKDVALWYETFVRLCTKHILSDAPSANQAKIILEDQIWRLSVNVKCFDVLEESAKKITKHQSWSEAWIVLNNSLNLNPEDIPAAELTRLRALIDIVKPKRLEDLARTYAFGAIRKRQNLVENSDLVVKDIQKITADLVKDEAVLDILLPDLLSIEGSNLYNFGHELAGGCTDKMALWRRLYQQLKNMPQESRKITLLCGFLSRCAKDAPETHDRILDGLVHDPVLGHHFPALQIHSHITQKGIERLHQSLSRNDVDIEGFFNLVLNRADENIGDDDLARLLREISKKENGNFVVFDILTIRFDKYSDTHKAPSCHSPKLQSAAREMLLAYDYGSDRFRKNNMADLDLTKIAKICFSNAEYEQEIKTICDHLFEAITNHSISASDVNHYMVMLAEKQPMIFMDCFLGNNQIPAYRKHNIFAFSVRGEKNPLNNIPDHILMKWCDQDAKARYPLIVRVIDLFEQSKTGSLVWKDVFYKLVDHAPEVTTLLDWAAETIRPNSWRGSFADALQTRLVLFEPLQHHQNDQLRSWAQIQLSQLEDAIKRERESERNNEYGFE